MLSGPLANLALVRVIAARGIAAVPDVGIHAIGQQLQNVMCRGVRLSILQKPPFTAVGRPPTATGRPSIAPGVRTRPVHTVPLGSVGSRERTLPFDTRTEGVNGPRVPRALLRHTTITPGVAPMVGPRAPCRGGLINAAGQDVNHRPRAADERNACVRM